MSPIDAALDAISLIENSADDNPTNRDAILRQYNTHDDLAGLIVALVKVAAMVRHSYAVKLNVDPREIDEVTRAAFIFGGAR